MNIPLGYEVGTGKRVDVPLNHTGVLGQTQLSGKTTTLEALVMRSGLRAIAFITKPGEKSFRMQTPIPAFFSESTMEEYWKHVIAILEYRGETRLGFRERGLVMKLCQDYKKTTSRMGTPDARTGKTKRVAVKYGWDAPKSLRDLLNNIESYLPESRGIDEQVCIQLREYLRPAIAEIEKMRFAGELKLSPGINVMNLTDLTDGLKTLVIRSVIEHVHKKMRKTIVIVPEAWKFIPEGRTTPVKLALEGLIREGAGLQNFVWIDSQDLRGVDKKLLRSVIVWLFGVQRQRNEVASTLDSMPDHPKPTATEIMQLGKGQFYACYSTTLVKTYVQPYGMESEHAKAIALGDEAPESWKGISAALGRESAAERSDEDHGTGESDRGDALADEDEAMWKEKYDDLYKEHVELIGAHDALAKRVLLLESITGVPPAPAVNGTIPKVEVSGEQDPVILRVMQDRPEIRVTRQIRTIDADGSTLNGALGILIAEKFFDGVRESADIRRELIRRGFLGNKAPNHQISLALQRVVEWGFLTKEDAGYQCVTGMKINIVEVRA
jgi:hypothetical protein